MTSSLRLRLGTRASALARWQANWVAAQLTAQGVVVELVPITTQGDTQTRDPISNVGSPGVFTKELQRALLAEQIDLAVHSLKDLPTDKIDGLCLTAVPERETVSDVLISRAGLALAALPQGAIVGTGSLRRRAQLLHARSDLQMRGIRGNVDTRLAKLAAGDFDAIVLAAAGLKRLGLDAQVTEVLDTTWMLPAVGQGALGIECRTDDASTRQALASLNHFASQAAVIAERTLLADLAGGCLAPVGAWARVESGNTLRLDAAVLSADGRQRIAAGATGTLAEAARLGDTVAAELIAAGASALIQASRETS